MGSLVCFRKKDKNVNVFISVQSRENYLMGKYRWVMITIGKDCEGKTEMERGEKKEFVH